ncbi:S9 family peptidase [Flavihumibacter sp. UBA7668]|uniref:S9 family peptidase n=1 Tax=Flavihumibacter sp. UBA7668 TaxID=1946542 RepID=UPI0025B7AB60|nr:DPP IV N-terminal domain-containing protein [Flavihumibacter sp. UBA7668]
MRIVLLISALFVSYFVTAQGGIHWTPDGSGYFSREKDAIRYHSLSGGKDSVFLSAAQLTPAGATAPLALKSWSLSELQDKVLLFTNAKKVWRYETRGDYYVYDRSRQQLKKTGNGLPPSSQQFAKISPDGKKLAYVSAYNLYVEDLQTGQIQALTKDGNRKRINGTFDWAYEEEFFCRDGFRWSPDSRKIAFWQINAGITRDYLMLNTTDSIYPKVIPVEYPVAGEKPSTFRIGVIELENNQINWMKMEDDPIWGSYLPRMEWAANSSELVMQHLDRKQQVSTLFLANALTGTATPIFVEKDSAWIDILPSWDQDYTNGGWDWIKKGGAFLWASEKDGWRHLYSISRDGKSIQLITKGAFDVMDIAAIDEKGNYLYFIASPANATQRYLYRSRLDGKGEAERVSPANQTGTHYYDISPGARFAQHSFSNHYIQPVQEIIQLKNHEAVAGTKSINEIINKTNPKTGPVEFFTIRTSDGIEMDGWIAKPSDFDSSKKYPVVFYVYTEPWGQTAKDEFGAGYNHLYKGNMLEDGYIYISMDNRGTPVPKGRSWRKSVYRKIGLVNIRDQAMAAKEILKWSFIDPERVAVWGWSGGGSATLNLLFQYPEIYKTGISVAAVGNQLTYDNIYQERYMGLPQENLQDFINGSPITYAKNLRGHLLYIHGTGDDNVHYNNAEMLINALIKYNRQFQLMSYPNRSHSISEGEGTFEHLSQLYTSFLKTHCPPGAK